MSPTYLILMCMVCCLTCTLAEIARWYGYRRTSNVLFGAVIVSCIGAAALTGYYAREWAP